MGLYSLKSKSVSRDLFKRSLIVKVGYNLKGYNKLIYTKYNTIIKTFLGKTFYVYKGKNYRTIKVNNNLLGFKYGEFSFTRKPFKYEAGKSSKNLRR